MLRTQVVLTYPRVLGLSLHCQKMEVRDQKKRSLAKLISSLHQFTSAVEAGAIDIFSSKEVYHGCSRETFKKF